MQNNDYRVIISICIRNKLRFQMTRDGRDLMILHRGRLILPSQNSSFVFSFQSWHSCSSKLGHSTEPRFVTVIDTGEISSNKLTDNPQGTGFINRMYKQCQNYLT